MASHAVALPIASHGDSDLAAILVAGANPMRPLEESRTFHTLIAGHLETAISNARATTCTPPARLRVDAASSVSFEGESWSLLARNCTTSSVGNSYACLCVTGGT